MPPDGSCAASPIAGGGGAPALTLDRVIGQTCTHNNALAINPITGDVAYPAGCIVVIYQPRRNRQFRYFTSSNTVSCVAFSRDGGMLAAGERGHQPLVTVWSLATGITLWEMATGHRFGIGCVAFTPSGGGIATMGFKHDRMLRVWDLLFSPTDSDALSRNRSASPPFGNPLDPNAPPQPPTEAERERSLPQTATATRNDRYRQVASARVPQRVRGMTFTSDGERLVTCGDGGHVKFWTMPVGNAGGFIAIGSDAASSAASCSHSGDGGGSDGILEGWSATLSDEHKGATFVDVTAGKEGGEASGGLDSVFCVTAGGLLCAFTRGGVLEKWVSLEAPSAYGVSVHDGTLAAACADGLVRLFHAADLQYIATLPRPPPLGRANISSIRELQLITDAAAACAPARTAVQAPAGVSGHSESDAKRTKPEGASDGSVRDQTGSVARYPAALGCRLNPSGTKVVCIYADRSMFIWDVTDPLCVGKYRSFLAHGACIWDIQRVPSSVANAGEGQSTLPDIPEGAIVTCSADDTIRVWDLGALDGKSGMESRGDKASHSGRWSNIYSKHLLRILYGNTKENNLKRDPATMVAPVTDMSTSKANDAQDVDDGEKQSGHGYRYKEDAENTCDIDVGDFEGAGETDGERGTKLMETGSEGTDEAEETDKYSRLEEKATGGGESESAEARQDDSVQAERESAVEDIYMSEGAFDPETPRKPECSRAPRSLAVHPNGLQVACGDKQGNIHVYDMAVMQPSHSQVAHEAEILCLAYSPMLVPSGGDAGSATSSVVNATDSSAVVDDRSTPGSPSSPASDRGGGKTGGRQRSVITQEEATSSDAENERWLALDPLDSRAVKKCLSGAERRSSGGTGDECEYHKGSEYRGRPRHERPVVLLASAGRDGRVQVFDASETTGSDDRQAADGSGETKLERATTGSGTTAVGFFPLVTTLNAHSSSVTAVKFSKDGTRLISAGGDKMLVLNSVRGPNVHRLKAVSVSQGTIYGLDVDPTNNYLVTAGQDKRLNIWSLASGRHMRAYKVERPLLPPPPPPRSPGVAPRQGGIPDGPAGVRQGEGGKAKAGGELFRVDLDPTGMYAAACSFDKWIRLFDFYSGKCLAKVSGHSELATGVRFTSDGRRLVSTGGDGVMFVWRLSSELQQTMHDRMCELRPGDNGSEDYGCSGLPSGGSAVEEERRESPLEASPSLPGNQTGTATTGVISPPIGPSEIEVARPPQAPTAEAAEAAEATEAAVQAVEGAETTETVQAADATGTAASATPTQGSQMNLAVGTRAHLKIAVGARAQAKAEAKARLRFQRYHLPAWAHTRRGTQPRTATNDEAETPQSVSPPDAGDVVAGMDDTPSAKVASSATSTSQRYISGRIGSCVDDTAGSMGRRVPQLPAASTVKGVIGEALDGHKRELIPTTVEKQEEPEGRLEDSSTPKEDGRVLRDEAKEMGAPVASSTGGIPAAARTVTAVGGGGAEQEGYANREQARPRARGETGAGLRGARGRWGKRSKEESPLEVLGHRIGRLLLEDSRQRSEHGDRLKGAGSTHDGYGGDGAGGMGVGIVDLIQSREEEEDGVILGSPGGDGDDDDNKEEENQTYSMDDDFEDAANDFKGEQQERSFEGVRTPDGALPDRSDDDEKESEGMTAAAAAAMKVRPPPEQRQGSEEEPEAKECGAADAVAGVAKVSVAALLEAAPNDEQKREGKHTNVSGGGSSSGSVGQGGSVDGTAGDSFRRRRSARDDIEPGAEHRNRLLEARGTQREQKATVVGETSPIADPSAPKVEVGTARPGVNAAMIDGRDQGRSRGRRISETEGAVENMRRRLSAMGFLEPSTSPARVEGDSATRAGGQNPCHSNAPSGAAAGHTAYEGNAAKVAHGSGISTVGGDDVLDSGGIKPVARSLFAASSSSVPWNEKFASEEYFDTQGAENEGVIGLNGIVVQEKVAAVVKDGDSTPQGKSGSGNFPAERTGGGGLGRVGEPEGVLSHSRSVSSSPESQEPPALASRNTPRMLGQQPLQGPLSFAPDVFVGGVKGALTDAEDASGPNPISSCSTHEEKSGMGNRIEAAEIEGQKKRETKTGDTRGSRERVQVPPGVNAGEEDDDIIRNGGATPTGTTGIVREITFQPQPSMSSSPSSPPLLSTASLHPSSLVENVDPAFLRSSHSQDTFGVGSLPLDTRQHSGSAHGECGGPSSAARAVLPRPQEEYQMALVRLKEAAAFAAELYGELSEASIASSSVGRTGSRDVPESMPVAEWVAESFAGFVSPVKTGDRGGTLEAKDERGTVGVTEHLSVNLRGEKRSGRTNGRDIGKDLGVSEEKMSTDDAGSETCVGTKKGGEARTEKGEKGRGDDETDEYDDEWDEEEQEHEEAEEAGVRERRGTSSGGPVFLRQSFLESFATVNEVLSSIASRTANDSSTLSSSNSKTRSDRSRRDGGQSSVRGRRLKPPAAGSKAAEELTSATSASAQSSPSTQPRSEDVRREPGTDGTGGADEQSDIPSEQSRSNFSRSAFLAQSASSSSLRANTGDYRCLADYYSRDAPTSFSPMPSIPDSHKQREMTRVSGDGLREAAGRTEAELSSPLEAGRNDQQCRSGVVRRGGGPRLESRSESALGTTTATGEITSAGVLDRGMSEMPPEMSGMLQRYSEMMLRVVQEKLDARIPEETKPHT